MNNKNNVIISITINYIIFFNIYSMVLQTFKVLKLFKKYSVLNNFSYTNTLHKL